MSDQSTLLLLIQQLQQELQNQRNEIQTLRADLNASRADVQLLQTRLLSQTPRSRLPDPPRFDGKPYTLRTWLPSIRAKLRSDHLSGADAFDYVWDRLEQPQQASVLHLRQSAEETQSWDAEAIFSFFQRLCHNPREHQEAMQRFSTVRQREEESLIAFLARFERLMYEAEATTWPDSSRMATLHRGLRPSLRQTLEDTNDSLFSLAYDEYVELVQLIDRRTRRPQPAKNPASKPMPAPTDLMDTDPVRISRIRTIRSAPRVPSTSSSQSSAPKRRAYRLEHDLCLYCGSDDHWIEECDERSCRSSSPTTSQPGSPVPAPAKPRTKTTARSSTMDALLGQRPPEVALKEGGIVMG